MLKADRLATWAAGRANVGDPHFLVKSVAAAFDVPVQTKALTGKAGMLDLVDGRVIIFVDNGVRTRRRFSAAHELGHFLLAATQGVTLAQQTADRGYERYCNAFASHLLLPRPWVHAQAENQHVTMATVIGLARSADCSFAATTTALNDAAGWDQALLSWRRSTNGRWSLDKVISTRPGRHLVESVPQTDAVLDDAGEHPRQQRVHLRVDGEPVVVTVELVRFRRSAFALAPAGHVLDCSTRDDHGGR